MMRPIPVVLAALLVLGCATAPDVEGLGAGEPAADELSSGIWCVETGDQLEIDDFMGRLSEARFVVVGESHGDDWDHDVQRRIYEGLSKRRPGRVILGLEMIERRFQEAVDLYVEGEIDEDEMLSQVEWEKRWGVEASYYAPMWRLARRQGQAVVALNARRELIRAVAEVGLEGLAEEDRLELPEIDESNKEYREYLKRFFSAHGAHGRTEKFERFYQAQLVWDETMADTAHRFMRERPQEELMVILAGRGHVEHRWGIPSRLERRGTDRVRVAVVSPFRSEGKRGRSMATHRDLESARDEQVADYLWIR